MDEIYFINEFLTAGFAYYFNKSKDGVFEGHIVNCLCDIYGRDNLQTIYETKNESAFIDLMRKYGLAPNLYDNFIHYTNRYEKFKKEQKTNPTLKTDVANKIEIMLITMYIYKCFLIEPSMEELGLFENDLLNDFNIIKIHFNISLNPNQTRELWSKKKRMIDDNVDLVKIMPTYLDDFTYAKYGTSREEVEKMDYRMVEELNSYIKSKQALEVEEDPPKEKTRFQLLANTSLSSGNGFVDFILIASIIATEFSIGLIYLFLHL